MCTGGFNKFLMKRVAEWLTGMRAGECLESD